MIRTKETTGNPEKTAISSPESPSTQNPDGTSSHLLTKSASLRMPPTKEQWQAEAMLVYQNGYHPIPKGTGKQAKAALFTPELDGSRPTKGEVQYSPEFMQLQIFSHGYCIGTDNLAFLDFDCPNQELAEHMINFVMTRLDGKIIVRIGNAPKFAIPVNFNERASTSTPAFYDSSEKKNQFEVIAGKSQHAAVAGTCNPEGGRYQITTDNNFSNTKVMELPNVDSSLLQELMNEFNRICLAMGMTNKTAEVPPNKAEKPLSKAAQRSIPGDIFTKISRDTGLGEAADELEDLGWAICEGFQNGAFPTFQDRGLSYSHTKHTRPGKTEGISASLIEYEDGLILKVFTTSDPDIAEGNHKFADAIKHIKYKGDSRQALLDFVERVGDHPFYKKYPTQDLIEQMAFDGSADIDLLRQLRNFLKTKPETLGALNWFGMSFEPEDLELVFQEKRLRSISGSAFLSMDIPATENLLSPIIEKGGLTLVTAKAGVGKSHFALGCAIAAASGGKFLRYSAGRPIPVIYVDGEMSSHDIQKRLQRVTNPLSLTDRKLALQNLQIIAASEQESTIPCLSTDEGQKAISENITSENTLLILDNVSTLVRNGSENDDQNWIPVQEWLVQLRKRGVTVLLIHHDGKGEAGQRGTSKRADIMNTVIQLSRPSDYEDGQGARFVVKIVKGRSISGDDSVPFEAWLKNDLWIVRPVDQSMYDKAVINLKQYSTCSEIASSLGISKSYASKLAQRALKEGVISTIKKENPGRKAK